MCDVQMYKDGSSNGSMSSILVQMEAWVDLCGLLGVAIKAMQQGGDDAVHSPSCATLEQDAECSSSSLHSNQQLIATCC